MQILIALLLTLTLSGTSSAFYPGPLTGTAETHSVNLDTDLAHGRVLTIGGHIFHGTFDCKAWQYDEYRAQARLEKRDADSLNLVSKIVFPDDQQHRNIADVQYSPRQHRIYVLFMGGLLASIDPDYLGWCDVNQPEDLRANEMGKIVVSPDYIYRISQTYPVTIVTQYNADNGVESHRTTLDVQAGHGGLYAHGMLYVTTSQNDGLGSMVYMLNPHTLEVMGSHRIANCENIAPDFDIIYNHDGHPSIVFVCEGKDQNKARINNLFIADAYNPSTHHQYSTNTTVQGGIWGVTAANGLVFVSRGSNPATIEAVSTWAQTSTIYEIPGVAGCNGGVDIVGKRIYWKAYQQMHTNKQAAIGWMEIQ